MRDPKSEADRAPRNEGTVGFVREAIERQLCATSMFCVMKVRKIPACRKRSFLYPGSG
jgi:hypothetical protein